MWKKSGIFVENLGKELLNMSMFGLLALVATFAVESSKSVSVSGVIPEAATAVFSSTGSGKRLTSGTAATLTLTGWQNVEIESVRLSMKSNKSAGAGSLEMTVDGASVWTIPDSGFDQWYGAYSAEYVDIVHTFSSPIATKTGKIEIAIQSSQNSLYIEEYVLVYHKTAARAYTLTLHEEDGGRTTLTETAVGSGVVLPSRADLEGWKFLGWAEQAVGTTTHKPTFYAQGTTYRPTYDTDLYALYTDDMHDEPSLLQRTDCQSGIYAIAFPVLDAVYAGAVENNGISMEEVALTKCADSVHYERRFDIAERMMYYIDFLSDSTATIQHYATATWVGYKSKQLQDTPTHWRYRVCPDSTVAFFLSGDKEGSVHLLWLDVALDDYGGYCYGKVLKNMTESTLACQALLYEAYVPEGLVQYSTNPRRVSIEQVSVPETAPQEVRIGLYRLRISHGKKTLYLDK